MPSNGRSSYYIQCPCCDDSPRNKHLNINVKKDVYRCPRCGIYGGIFDLYALYTNTPRDKVHKELLKRLGSPERVERKKKTVLPVPVIDCPVTDIEARHTTYTALLSKLSLAQDHRQNLINRGLSDENIVKLGYKLLEHQRAAAPDAHGAVDEVIQVVDIVAAATVAAPVDVAGIDVAVIAVAVGDGIAVLPPVEVYVDAVAVAEGMLRHKRAPRLRLEHQLPLPPGFDGAIAEVVKVVLVRGQGRAGKEQQGCKQQRNEFLHIIFTPFIL